MPPYQHIHKPKSAGKPPPKIAVPTADSTTTSNCVQTAPLDPADLTPNNVLRLQNTMGNHAVQRMMTSGAATNITRGIAPRVQREVTSYNGFIKMVQETIKSTFGGKYNSAEIDNLMMGVSGAQALHKSRSDQGISKITDFEATVDLKTPYKTYEKAKDLQNLIALHSTLTLWQTMYAAQPIAKTVKPAFDVVLHELNNEMQKQTDKAAGLGGKGKGKGKSKQKDDPNDLSITSPEQIDPSAWNENTQMEYTILTGAGVPPAYFAKHLVDNPDATVPLMEFISFLEAGETAAALEVWENNDLNNVPGLKFIRSVLIANLADQANLGNVTTFDQSLEGTAVTREERDALIAYTSGVYEKMNEQLRGFDFTRSRPVLAGRKRINFRSNKDITETKKGIEPEAADNIRMNQMELAVRAMSKLPKYSGLAYRAMLEVPDGYLDTVHPGSMIADLGFSSASPTMTGVNNFRAGVGTRSVYFLIHTKTAVNVAGITNSPKEAEVLLRPGVRFAVKAVWMRNSKGLVPTDAPAEAQLVLHQQGDTRGIIDTDTMQVVRHEKIRVIEVIEV